MAFFKKVLQTNRTNMSEVLNEDLDNIDKRIAFMKTSCHQTHKKIQASLREGGQDRERKMRKLPEAQLAQQMKEASGNLGQDSLMGSLFQLCGEAEQNLSEHLVDGEINIENKVLTPLHNLSEQQIPQILKKKKQLEDLVYQFENAKKKHQTMTEKHPVVQAKVDNAKEEMEDAQNKVELCKDQLSTEMFSFSAKEMENSKFLLDFVEIQVEYHQQALKIFQEVLPKMRDVCEQSQHEPVFGTSLDEHLRRTNREIATVIEICIAILLEEGMHEEGLFRIAGSANKVKKVKAAFDAGLVPDMSEIRDVHCISGALKLYLRELAEPLLTYTLYKDWMDAAHLPHEQKLQQIWLLCERLPKTHHNNLRYLIKFLAKLSEKQDINKMTPSNIAIVIGPNLLWQQDIGQSVLTTSSQSAITEALISHADYFFPGDIEFWSGNTSDKSRESDNVTDVFMNPVSGNQLTKSASGSNLLCDSSSQDMNASSPKAPRRQAKKPAPLPPKIERPAPAPPSVQNTTQSSAGDTTEPSNSAEQLLKSESTAGPIASSSASQERNCSGQAAPGSTASLERNKERPATSEKPLQVLVTSSTGAVSVSSPPDRPPLPDRPNLPPPPLPPPNTNTSGSHSNNKEGEQSSVSQGGQNNITSKPERPRLPSDRPSVPPPDKPKMPLSLQSQQQAQPTSTSDTGSQPPPISPNPKRMGSERNRPPRPNNPPPMPHRHGSQGGSKGSEKDFPFLHAKDEGTAENQSQGGGGNTAGNQSQQQSPPPIPNRTSSIPTTSATTDTSQTEPKQQNNTDNVEDKPPNTPLSPPFSQTHL